MTHCGLPIEQALLLKRYATLSYITYINCLRAIFFNPWRTMSTTTDTQSVSPPRMTIWRVRLISCDGGQPGREWKAKFFRHKKDAKNCLFKEIAESDRRNPKYLFKTTEEMVDGVVGYCNWQFGGMLTMDAVEVH